MMVFAVAAVALDLLVGYARADFLRPCGVHRARRLCRRHSVRSWHRRRARRAASRHRRVDAVRLAHRHCVPADQGRLFHHDHARLRADGLFHRHVACALWRRQRADASRRATPSPACRCSRATARFIILPSSACWRLICSAAGWSFRASAACCAAARRTRPGWRRSASRVRRFQLVAYMIAGGLGGLSGFLLANLDRIRQPSLYVVAGIRRTDRHGHPRRRRHARWRHHRHRRLSRRRGMAVGYHRELAGHFRTASGARRSVRARRTYRARYARLWRRSGHA